MSIRSRIEDMNILLGQRRYEGALIMLLIAVDATAAKRYPTKQTGDRFEAFVKYALSKHFPEEQRPIRAESDDEGQTFSQKFSEGNGTPPPDSELKRDLPHVLYKVLRCNLVHEGRPPVDLEFHEGGEAITLTDHDAGLTVHTGPGLWRALTTSILQASENKNDFPKLHGN